MPSPNTPAGALKSAFSPYTDSPSSPAPFSPAFPQSSGHNAAAAAHPGADSLYPPPSPYPTIIEPSPVDSNGTATTEIDEDAQEGAHQGDDEAEADMHDIASPDSQQSNTSSSKLARIDTTIEARARSNSSDDAPQSVIHAPPGYLQFDANQSSPYRDMVSPAPTDKSTNTVVAPETPDSASAPDDQRESAAAEAPHAIDTSVPGAKNDRSTPRAQTRQEAEEEWKRRSRANKSLEDIAETEDTSTDKPAADDVNEVADVQRSQTMDQALEDLNQAEQEIAALKAALSECWTLCNTLAGLSSIHRERMFSFSGQGEQGEQAWKSCWRLCQKLYESRDEDHASQVRPTLELCRDFCQALFEARHRADETSDSVLRVSFELNNHLYNTHDRNLPEAFRERTLDFYLTLCHRLMKQRTSLPQETDALLRACWSLAEMLFTLRQNSRDGKAADEELLGSAVQACWELCDLFREGWTQIRPDRGTPRPSQSTFPVIPNYTSGVTSRSTTTTGTRSVTSRSSVTASERSSSLDDRDNPSHYHNLAPSILRGPPETPTTIFDDTADELSPDEPSVPNILVLGPETATTRTHNRWSSAASTLSGFSETSSQRTSSTATVGRKAKLDAEGNQDPHLLRLKALILAAAVHAGYNRTSNQPLSQFVKALPSNSFGTASWQTNLLASFRKLVQADPTLRVPGFQVRKFSAAEVARAVQWMGRAQQFGWLRDLFRLVFGFLPEDAGSRGNVGILG
ncbi:hypothetical protein K490DRAFT_34916 [Saccharata proteae CBS 121410]|uniref:DUF7624 domain-containing protein n=1 Tax=Saccharata proteae CBS 121410 TaxID=1314787 RepID=A0A9P4I0M7_9PEZI|nr:hypothetical protein K490DRAFT_34916 [Saccharata proteae CBS 121410]